MTTPETNKSTFLATLKALGFKVGKTANSLLSNTAYKITVKVVAKDVASSTIDFGPEITVHHKSACNFLRPENLVTLECVLRLLRKGYPACSIELEKTWKLGHREKGRLDILIRHKKAVFAMIECKTWGEEYLKERDKALEDGGQLFSYFVQERTAKVLALYCSKVDSRDVTFQAESINTTAIAGTNLEEMHSSWDKSFVQDGLFHESATVYDSKKRNLQKNNLRELDRDSGRGLFNSFAEILRRHVISDKSNAFNKIFNLFVCKIYDEDTKRPTDDLDFQWKVSDTLGTLMERLGSLYMRGLKDYLAIEITKDHFRLTPNLRFLMYLTKTPSKRILPWSRKLLSFSRGIKLNTLQSTNFLGIFLKNF